MRISNVNKRLISDKASGIIYLPNTTGARLVACPSLYMLISGIMKKSDVSDDVIHICDMVKNKKTTYADSINQRELFENWDQIQGNEKPLISQHRVEAGFKAGLIDHVNGAIIKTESGWLNQNRDIVLQVDARLDEVLSYTTRHADVANLITTKEMDVFLESDKIVIDGDVIATRASKEDSWTMPYGERVHGGSSDTSYDVIERVISHSDKKFFFVDRGSDELYHGSVSSKEIEHGLSGEPDKNSRTGAGTYTTKSLHEAITVYANPFSFSQSTRRLIANDAQVGSEKRNFSHLHVLSATGQSCLYHARLDSPGLTNDEMPSPHALSLLISERSKRQEFDDKMMHGVYLSSNTYEVYSALKAINESILAEDVSDGSFLPTVLASMGYDGIDIDFPSEQFLDSISMLRDKIKLDMPDELVSFKEQGFKPAGVDRLLRHYQTRLLEGIPPKASMGHVIFFDGDKGFEVQRSVALPKHIRLEHPSLTSDPFYDVKKIDFLMMPEKDMTPKAERFKENTGSRVKVLGR